MKRPFSIFIKVAIAAFLISFIFLGFFSAFGSQRKGERYYQVKWCAANRGEMEVRMSDGTRADCVTETHAVEMDFARKWAEGLGQALRYARLTGKRGAVALIWKNQRDRAKIMNLIRDVRYYKLPIDVFLIEAE